MSHTTHYQTKSPFNIVFKKNCSLPHLILLSHGKVSTVFINT